MLSFKIVESNHTGITRWAVEWSFPGGEPRVAGIFETESAAQAEMDRLIRLQAK